MLRSVAPRSPLNRRRVAPSGVTQSLVAGQLAPAAVLRRGTAMERARRGTLWRTPTTYFTDSHSMKRLSLPLELAVPPACPAIIPRTLPRRRRASARPAQHAICGNEPNAPPGQPLAWTHGVHKKPPGGHAASAGTTPRHPPNGTRAPVARRAPATARAGPSGTLPARRSPPVVAPVVRSPSFSMGAARGAPEE